MVRWGRPTVVLLAVVAGVLVALAAAGEPMRAATGASRGGELPDWILIVPASGVVLAAIGAVIILREGGGERRPIRRRSILPTLMMIAFAVLIASLIGRPDDGDPLDEEALDPATAAVADPAEAEERTSWPAWMLVAGAGAVVAVALLARRLRASPASTAVAGEGDEPATTAIRTLTASVGALGDADDPRAGVIAAYAQLLEGLGDAGAARRPDEAPFEHVARALQRLGVRPEPLGRLTELFAEARFSTHPITEEHRREAQACLRATLDDLEALSCA